MARRRRKNYSVRETRHRHVARARVLKLRAGAKNAGARTASLYTEASETTPVFFTSRDVKKAGSEKSAFYRGEISRARGPSEIPGMALWSIDSKIARHTQRLFPLLTPLFLPARWNWSSWQFVHDDKIERAFAYWRALGMRIENSPPLIGRFHLSIILFCLLDSDLS